MNMAEELATSLSCQRHGIRARRKSRARMRRCSEAGNSVVWGVRMVAITFQPWARK